MKRITTRNLKLLATVIASLASGIAFAGDVFFDMDTDPTLGGSGFIFAGDHLPNAWCSGLGTGTNGNPSTGGYLSLGDGNIFNNGQALVAVFPDVDSGFPIKAFHLTCDVRAGNSGNGNGRPADGFSISYCRDGDRVLVNATNGAAGGAAGGDNAGQTTDPNGSGDLENGTKSGVAILFDAWQGNMLPDTGPIVNGLRTPGPDVEGIEVRVDDKTLVQVDMQADRNGGCNYPTNAICGPAVCADTGTEQTGPWANDGGAATTDGTLLGLCWARLDVELTTNKLVTVTWKGRVLVDHFALTNYPNHRGRLVLMGRTGGNAQNAHFDNIHLVTTPAIEATFGTLSAGPGLNQFQFTINDNGPSVVTNISQVILDGNNVTSSVTSSKVGGTTTGTYTQGPRFAPGSTHTVTVTWQTSLGQTLSSANNLTFTIVNYTVVPTNALVTAGVDITRPGFRMLPWQSGGEPNRVYWANEQVVGLHGTNNADLSSATNGGYVVYTNVINFDINGNNDGDFQAGNGYPDSPFPGIPGLNGTDNVAEEILCFLRFQTAGTYTMGVNSDDGFSVTVGNNPKDRLATSLGQFDGGRGASDTIFTLVVDTAGIYPFRVLWFNGGGGANLEWFTVQNGAKILVNDPDATNTTGVAAFYSGPALPAWVSQINPYIGAGNTRPDVLIVQLTDGSTTVNGGSISLKVNGSPVTTTVSKVGNVTTVLGADATHLLPPGADTATLVWSDSGGATRSNSWSFTVEPYVTLDAGLRASLQLGDASAAGFTLQVAQVDPCLPIVINPSGPDDCGDGTENQIDSANAMIAGLYYPWYGTNSADVSTAVTSNIWYWTNVIDFNIVTSGGDFPNDYPLPGIPSGDGVASRPYDSFSAALDGYVAFPTAGFYQLGVASDDGFRLSEGLGVSRQVLHVHGTNVDRDVAAVVSSTNNTGAPWNTGLPLTPITAPVVYVGSSGCPNPTTVNLSNAIALIDQDRCTPGNTAPGGYNRLVYMCQTNGALACIVEAFPDWGTPELMTGGSLPITIPAVHVNGFNGEKDWWHTNGPLIATIGADAHLKLGEADRGKGMDRVDFGFVVPTPGLYPMHLIYEQGGGGAGLEWTRVLTVPGDVSFDASSRVLMNDPSTGSSLLGYRALVQARFTSESVAGGIVTITWIGSGTLQQSTSLLGGWTDVSPQPTGNTYSTAATGPQKFFRIRQF